MRSPLVTAVKAGLLQWKFEPDGLAARCVVDAPAGGDRLHETESTSGSRVDVGEDRKRDPGALVVDLDPELFATFAHSDVDRCPGVEDGVGMAARSPGEGGVVEQVLAVPCLRHEETNVRAARLDVG